MSMPSSRLAVATTAGSASDFSFASAECRNARDSEP